MRLARILVDGSVRTAAAVTGGYVDLHQLMPELAQHAAPGDVAALLHGGEALWQEAARRVMAGAYEVVVATPQGRLLAPLSNPPKIICSWVNYPNPAVAKLPPVPIFFSKYASAIIGSGEVIRLPRIGSQIVVEPELAVVIGTAGRHIAPEQALGHVAAYTIVNDVTAFSHRLQVLLGSSGPYMMAKTFDTFAPMGPYLVTREEIVDPHRLRIRQWQNEQLQVDSSTAHAIFKVPELISYISQFFTLEPGDLILTGSPPPEGKLSFLSAGDTVRIEIEGLGVLENPVADELAPVLAP